MAIFNSYVSLPEGRIYEAHACSFSVASNFIIFYTVLKLAVLQFEQKITGEPVMPWLRHLWPLKLLKLATVNRTVASHRRVFQGWQQGVVATRPASSTRFQLYHVISHCIQFYSSIPMENPQFFFITILWFIPRKISRSHEVFLTWRIIPLR